MQRYHLPSCLGLGLSLMVGGCAVPTQRENVDATARLLAGKVPASLEWRLDSKADSEARQRAEAMLVDGVTLDEAVKVSFLASPDLQLALEKLEITRADFVTATTAPNPVAVVGAREPNGDLAAFYPDRNFSFGVLQDVISLLKIPDRRKIARLDLQRARYEAADSAVRLAAEVAQAWITYCAAEQVRDLRERAVAIIQVDYDNLQAAQANGAAGLADALASDRSTLIDHKADLIRAQLEATRARTALGEKMGVAGWHDDWALLQSLPPLPATDPDPASEEHAALSRRLDLLAAGELVEGRLRVLATQRRFRWLNQLDLGVFRDQATGGATFTGPNAVIELPIFDQRKAALLAADAQLRSDLRSLDIARLAARSEIRGRSAEMAAARALVEQIERDVQPDLRRRQAAPQGGDPNDSARLKLRLDLNSTEEARIVSLRDYWRARSALALAAGDWSGLNGFR